MEKSRISIGDNEAKTPVGDELEEFTKDVTIEKDFDGHDLYFYNNTFWGSGFIFKSIFSFHSHFQPKNSDIILATAIKSGTTWLKALAFTIINRAKYSPNTENMNPLLTTNPHDLVPNLEFHIYRLDQNPSLDNLPTPRIFQTHLPFSALPKSIVDDSKCRIVHICRNPLDQFVSYWHFFLNRMKKERANNEIPSIDEAFELFCRGVHHWGPFWDYALGFWQASVENPERVLFLRYEDLKDDINKEVKKIAEFLGFGFSMEEENQGVVEQICNICSFENLKGLEVNKDGQLSEGIMNNTFFRNGQVGDWVNYISPSQAKRLEDITKQKLDGSGLKFKTFCD